MGVYVFVRTGRETTLSAARFAVIPTAQFWRSTTRRHKLRVSFVSFSPRGIGSSRLLKKSLIEGRLLIAHSFLCIALSVPLQSLVVLISFSWLPTRSILRNCRE
jgi:hypothetical protein